MGVKEGENPSQSHPGTPHCCCGDSLMEDADVLPWSEVGSRQLCLQAVVAVLYEGGAPACAEPSVAAVLHC